MPRNSRQRGRVSTPRLSGRGRYAEHGRLLLLLLELDMSSWPDLLLTVSHPHLSAVLPVVLLRVLRLPSSSLPLLSYASVGRVARLDAVMSCPGVHRRRDLCSTSLGGALIPVAAFALLDRLQPL